MVDIHENGCLFNWFDLYGVVCKGFRQRLIGAAPQMGSDMPGIALPGTGVGKPLDKMLPLTGANLGDAPDAGGWDRVNWINERLMKLNPD